MSTYAEEPTSCGVASVRSAIAEVDGVVRGSGAFYPESTAQDLGWPAGWAGGRALEFDRDLLPHVGLVAGPPLRALAYRRTYLVVT